MKRDAWEQAFRAIIPLLAADENIGPKKTALSIVVMMKAHGYIE